jgi:predicted XRE-type DNA-binding protein
MKFRVRPDILAVPPWVRMQERLLALSKERTMTRPMKDDFSVIQGSGNIFADLDLPDADEHMLKARVALLVGVLIKESGLTQKAVGARLGLAQSDVSNLLRGYLRPFNLVRLLVCLRALGSDIEIKVKRPPVKQPSEADEAEKHKGRMSLMVA